MNETTPHKPAKNIQVGDRVVVSASFARYIGQHDLYNRTIPVVNVTDYGRTIGITLYGCPEVNASPSAPIPVADPVDNPFSNP